MPKKELKVKFYKFCRKDDSGTLWERKQQRELVQFADCSFDYIKFSDIDGIEIVLFDP